MEVGVVKWFNPTKGYGFIKPDNGTNDVFVHITAVKRIGQETLAEGQKIEYELADHNGRTSAINLKPLA